jgi:hypothetical protein
MIGCDGNHMILHCEKLLGMGLAERRKVVERSGLCTFCLRHAAELECYAKGGLSKPRCTRPGCDGEHASGVHSLMGEADAEVNLVAGDEGEAVSECEGGREDEYRDGHEYQHEWEDEGLWVSTVGATEAPEKTNRPEGTNADRDPAQRDDPAEVEGEMNQYECEYESLWVGTVGATEVPEEAGKSAGITVGRRPAQEGDPVKTEEGATRDDQRVAEAGQPRLRARPKAISDRQWERARYDAWLRQLLSDDSSDEDEDEERYGRFAESGRWMTELYGIPQHPTTTSGRECSA